MINRLPLRGRDAALDDVADLVVRIRSGTGALLLVEAARGMGKSRLLEEAGAISARYGIAVSRASAVAGEHLVPLAPFREALRGVAGGHELISLLERGTYAGLAAKLEPRLMCLDDLQWADDATIAALNRLPRLLAGVPLGVIAAVDPALRQLRHAAVSTTLGPLDDASVRKLAKDAFGAPPDPALLELLRQARGVPAELTPLLLGLAEEERIVTSDARACLLPRDGVPARVEVRLRERLEALTPLGRQVAVAAAVMGPGCTTRQLAALVEHPSASDGVDDLLAAGLAVSTADGGLQLTGIATRQLVLATLPHPTLTALQRQAAALLLDGGATPVEVADLVLAGARPGDGHAARTLLDAARSLLASDPPKGAELCHRAIGLPRHDDPVRGELAALTVRLLHAAGRVDEAQDWAARWVQDLSAPADRSAILLEVSELFALSADVRAAANRRALALDGIDMVSRARHQARLGANLAVAGRLTEAQRHLETVADAVADADDPRADSALAFAETAVDNARGRYERAVQPAHPAVWTDNVHADAGAFLRCGTLLTVGRLQDALATCDAGAASALAARQRWAARMWAELRLRVLLALGRPLDVLAAAETTAPQALSIVPEASALAAVATAAIHAGDVRTTQACAATASPAATGAAPEVRHHAAWIVLRCSEASGDRTQVAAWAAPPLSAQRPALPRLAPSSADAVVLTRFALAAGDDELARNTAAFAAARALLNPGSDYLAAFAAHTASLVAANADGLAEAAAQLGDAGAVLAQASALEDLGHMSVHSSATRADGIAHLDEALGRYEHAGAERDAARVRRRLRREAERRRPAARTAPVSAAGDLTAAERRVVDLVASGLTNREAADRLSISPNTVGTHLRHAFAKLGVSSRRELVLRALTPDGEESA